MNCCFRLTPGSVNGVNLSDLTAWGNVNTLIKASRNQMIPPDQLGHVRKSSIQRIPEIHSSPWHHLYQIMKIPSTDE